MGCGIGGAEGLLHGGDYNPEQWKDEPGIWDQDLRLMNLAHINAVSVGIFSWASLEPHEGQFEFGWLDDIIDRLSQNGQRIILATPSGARPAWMSQQYPEVRRVGKNGLREPHGGRHNHCPTSPVYRRKTALINGRLAERYGSHPALLLWHLSNEYGGDCHCDLCMAAFRRWLQAKYGSLDALNHAWWAAFWSHTFTGWDQITSIDAGIHGMDLDWRRFVTHQTVDFMRHEIAALRGAGSTAPVTTNMMGTYPGLDYWKFVPYLDVMSWDSYPEWHGSPRPAAVGPGPDWDVACSTAFQHDLYRTMKAGKPWLLMESTPSVVNWRPVSRLKRPGMHELSSLQAVAHGSDGAMYFQYRKSRGSREKFHGAVVDHAGHENTRVFREVAELGRKLEKLAPVAGSTSKADVAIIFDWENGWAIEASASPQNAHKEYVLTCTAHYRPFWKRGVPVDVINEDCDFAGYRLLVAPMLYMLRPGVADRIRAFVEAGGTFVATYLTGTADENDLCFLGGFPGPLRPVLGIWAEEVDALNTHDIQTVVAVAGSDLGLEGVYNARNFCEIIHLEGAEALAAYGEDFYASAPAVTCNRLGKGQTYYVASRNDDRFLDDLAAGLLKQTGIEPCLEGVFPEGVSVQRRSRPDRDFFFLLNFTAEEQIVALGSANYRCLVTGDVVSGDLALSPFGSAVIERAAVV